MPPGAPTCIGFRGVLLVMTISLSQVLQNQVSVLGGGQLHLTSCTKGAQVLASCPTFPVHTPLYRCTERQSNERGAELTLPDGIPPLRLYLGPPVRSSRDQAGNPDEGSHVGRAASELEKVMEINSRQPCAQLWPVIYQKRMWAWSCQNLQFSKRK